VSAGRILLVDDDPQIRRVMRVTLTGQGYEVDDVKTGDAALAKLRDQRRLCEPTAKEDRDETFHPDVSPDETLGWLPAASAARAALKPERKSGA
jgi:CheY-like chemotaxis protein